MATKEDAALMVQILQWSAAEGGVDAMRATMAPDFDPRTASVLDRPVFVSLLMGEMIGTFVKQGVLDRDLVYDLWAANLLWSRVEQAALRQRAEYGVPELWENFEALARGL